MECINRDFVADLSQAVLTVIICLYEPNQMYLVVIFNLYFKCLLHSIKRWNFPKVEEKERFHHSFNAAYATVMTKMWFNMGKRWLRRHILWCGKRNEEFTLLLGVLTNRRCNENKVSSVGCWWISPRYCIHLSLFTMICWRWAFLSRFSKLLFQNKIGATWKHKSKAKMHGVITGRCSSYTCSVAFPHLTCLFGTIR